MGLHDAGYSIVIKLSVNFWMGEDVTHKMTYAINEMAQNPCSNQFYSNNGDLTFRWSRTGESAVHRGYLDHCDEISPGEIQGEIILGSNRDCR